MAVHFSRTDLPIQAYRRLTDTSRQIAAALNGPRHCLRLLAVLTSACFLALVGLAVSKVFAQTFTYAYDELGRLIAVVDPSGNAGVYSYDKVGNLLSITN